MASGNGLRAVVLINNYNYGRYLDVAIASALAQTWTRCQVVVVDDGSTDHSRTVIESFGNRITPLLKANGGQASAINVGFGADDGDAWFLLDADDVLDPDIVATVMAEFSRYPETVRVQFPLRLIDHLGDALPGTIPSNPKAMPNGDILAQLLTHNDDIVWSPMSGNAYRGETLRAILPVPEQDYPGIGADLYLMNLAALHGPIRSLPDIGGGYRVHGANADFRSALDLERSCRIVKMSEATHRHLAFAARHLGIDERQIRRIGSLSLTLVAHRMILARLQMPAEPVSRRVKLATAGWSAAVRRRDVPIVRRFCFALWLGAMTVFPASIARMIGNLPFSAMRTPIRRWSRQS